MFSLSKMSANFYRHPSKKLKLIGITGTNGKTTTTFLIEKVLQESGVKVGVIDDKLELGENLSPLKLLKPYLELHYLLNEMLMQSVKVVVMEVPPMLWIYIELMIAILIL